MTEAVPAGTLIAAAGVPGGVLDFREYVRRKRLDPRFAAVTAAAYDMGLPLGEFLRWPAEDQEAAIAEQMYRRSVCRCGTHPMEWDEYEKERRDGVAGAVPPFAPTLRECLGCRDVEAYREEVKRHFKDSDGHADMDGRYVFLVPERDDREDPLQKD